MVKLTEAEDALKRMYLEALTQKINGAYQNPTPDKPVTGMEITTGTIMRRSPKIGRNTQCPCGSGLKYKHCCIKVEGTD